MENGVTMNEYIEIKGAITITPEFIEQVENEDWNEVTWRQDHPDSPHKDTETLYLRTVKEVTPEEVFNGEDCVTTKLCLDNAVYRQLIQYLTVQLELAEIGRVMIVKLKPGGHILPHADGGTYAAKRNRYHVPLTTNPSTKFCVGEEAQEFHLEVGYIYQLANKEIHSVWNEGTTDRIHIVFDGIPLEGADTYDIA